MVAKCADCWQVAHRLRAGCLQAARRLRVKKTRHRLVGRVAKCPQLRANCVNHQPLRPLVGYYILLMYLMFYISLLQPLKDEPITRKVPPPPPIIVNNGNGSYFIDLINDM